MTDRTARTPVLAWLLAAAVALAFADASIVVLALPQIYARFNTTIVGVSWVLTGYAIVVTVVALALAATYRRLSPTALVAVGLVVFAAASVGCGLAQSLTGLMVARAVQGIGAALLLTGALPMLIAAFGPQRGRSIWSVAATAGLAVGPALGGVLTQAFDWRAIFLFQAPVAVAAVAVFASRRARAGRTAASVDVRPKVLANLGLVFLSGGLVGALFLSVLLIIEVWRYKPIAGAAVVTALPVGMLLTRPLTRWASPLVQVAAGALLFGGGLAALALLPSTGAGWALAALALCGAGLGFLAGYLGDAALAGAERAAAWDGGAAAESGVTGGAVTEGTATAAESAEAEGVSGGPVRDSALVVSARHAGLVLGLVLIAPVLAGSLDHATQRSAIAGAGVVLDARAPLTDKVKIAIAVRNELDKEQRGQVPDLTATLDRAGLTSASDRRVGHDLSDKVTAVLTRSFRSGFGIAAGLGVLTLIPGLVLVARRRRSAAGSSRARLAAGAVATTLVLGIGAVLAAEQAAGAAGFGTYHEPDPCTAPANNYPGSGTDAVLQRIALSTVNGAACDLKISRERLLLSLDGKARLGLPPLSRPRLEIALRAGLVRAADDAQKRGELPAWLAGPLRALIANAPLDWLLKQVGLGG